METKLIHIKKLNIYVTPDYYMENGVRMPVGLNDAFKIADKYGMRLPTIKEVDAIYEAADIKLRPIFMKPGPQMSSLEYIQRHNRMIEEQIEKLNYKNTNGLLIAGHKKDLINIGRNSSRVAIYGWHRFNGTPVQPYSTVHHKDYFDYSHGLRLIKDG